MGVKSKKARREGTDVESNTNSDPDNNEPQSTHSRGETTPPTTGNTKQESDTTHSARIVSPNVHLAITCALIAIILGLVCGFMVTSSGNENIVFESPTLKRLESECRKKNKDIGVIQCVKDMLHPQENILDTWISEIPTVYKQPKDLRESLQTLQGIHSYMNENSITFPVVKRQVDSLDAHVTSLQTWKESTEEDIVRLKSDVDWVTKDLSEYKGEVDTFRSETKTNCTGLRSEINELKKDRPPPEKPDSDSWKEELAKIATNLSALEGNVSTFKQESILKLQDYEDRLNGIQNVKLLTMQSESYNTSKNVNDLTETVKTNKGKTDERIIQEHDNSIETVESKLKTVSTDVNALENGLKILKSKVDDNKKETDGQIQNIQGNLQTLSDRVDQNKKDTDATMSRQGDQIENIVKEQLPHLQIGIDDAKDKAKGAGDIARSNQQVITEHKTWAENRQDEYENYRKELKEKHGDTQFKQSVSQELINEMRNKMVLHDASFYMGMLSIGCCVLLFLNMMKNYKRSGRTPENRTRAGNQLRPREDNDVYYLKWSGPKENSVCVVTFHSETERQHTGETRSVFESVGANPPLIHARVIRRHTDIQDLPGSRIFLVFVDFNERNVILEDPAKGLGDLRVTTVRSLWKFGGDVAVIYCKDHGSRSLDGELFNRDLTSIYSQTELSQLKNQQRMLSIFEGFSDVQKQHCRDFIDRQLNRA